MFLLMIMPQYLPKPENFLHLLAYKANEKINHKNQLDEATRRQNEIYKSPDFYNK